MPRDDDTGRRLLANVIDSHATNNPTRVWASVPVNDEDLTQGFRDITYKEFADAINLASWWLAQNVANATAPFQTIAYSGPKDLRYPILAMAAVKCGKQVRCPCAYYGATHASLPNLTASFFLPRLFPRPRR